MQVRQFLQWEDGRTGDGEFLLTVNQQVLYQGASGENEGPELVFEAKENEKII